MMTAAQCSAEMDRLSAEEADLRAKLAHVESITDYQVTLSPQLERRADLKPFADAMMEARRAACGLRKRVLVLVSAPPQVGKTLTGQHAYAQWLACHPDHWLAYVSYSSDIAEAKSRDMRDLALRAGVKLRGDSSAVDRWQTAEGGGLLARGIQSGLTGQSGLGCIWFDDLYRDAIDARSPATAQKILDRLSSAGITRLHPTTSLVFSNTRWDTNDAIGFMEKLSEMPEVRASFDIIIVRLPCVDEITGEPLITYRGRDRDYYAAQRALCSESDWWSCYMAAPRPPGGTIFKSQGITRGPRPTRYRVAIGADFAYSTKTSADMSAAVVMLIDLDKTVEIGGRKFPLFYVDHAEEQQVESTDWLSYLKSLRERYQGASIHASIGGTELSIVSTGKMMGVPLVTRPTTMDKASRAQPASTTWKQQRIMLPEHETPGIANLVAKALDFTGRQGGKDDVVDAFVSAHDALFDADSWAMLNSGGSPAHAVPQFPTSRALGRLM